ncbi:hypothetical protein THAR02_06624 [Trichoderma harzianum]|uniref:DUF4419 domain-containing protein n=1 Tax=Trichoderma harzianum TaxID=5544 RepID=A0A0F9X7U2_TRIHA|nr:hypothetical protein THAR02_06624 [Trichoderma harzianum]
MAVRTSFSPLPLETNWDKATIIDANERSSFDDITSKCISPYKDDPRRKNKDSYGFRDFPIIASSIGPGKKKDKEFINETVSVPVSAHENGFVQGIIRALNQDVDIVIRPDDVWQAILSQFSLFINGRKNAEHLRHMFVSHEGKMALAPDTITKNLSELDFGKLAQEITSGLQDNVVDPELRKWMLPGFSTTTDHDKAVAAFGMMGAMQKYFDYGAMIGGSFSSVTLLGTRDDWEEIERRVDKLDQYGKECENWACLLQPIIGLMIKAFDKPDSPEVKQFWLDTAWETGPLRMSGDSYKLAGWITAFAYFKDDGSVAEHYDIGGKLWLGQVWYRIIHPDDISSSLVLVPITITDSEAGVQRFCTAVAGTIGMSMSDGGESQPRSKSQPFPAWWIVQEFEEQIAVNHNGTMAG